MNDFEQLPLRDIHLPDPISWWPPAPGWWLLPVVLALLALAGWRGWSVLEKRRRRRKLFRAAYRELDRIESEYKANEDTGRLLRELSIFVRRVAISTHPRREVAGMCGDGWAAWLRRSAADGGLDESVLALLVDGPYRKGTDADAVPLVSGCRRWLKCVARRPARGVAA